MVVLNGDHRMKRKGNNRHGHDCTGMAAAAAIAVLLLAAPAGAQLTGVSPTSGVFEMVAYSDKGPFGPMRGGMSITLSGTGAVKWTDTCYGTLLTNHPSKTGDLPLTLRVMYGTPGKKCELNFTGAKGGAARFTASVSFIPAATGLVMTDMLGNDLNSLSYCSKPNDGYRVPRSCKLQQSDIRPGGNFIPPKQGASYIDATYGALVVNQGTPFTRAYVGGNQISYDRQYVVLWNGVNAVLHRIDASDNSRDLPISGPDGICNVNSSANIGLGTTAASANLGFCLSRNGDMQQDIRQFSFAGGKLKDLDVLHRHPRHMATLWGTGQAAMDGWLSHIDDDNRICVLNWFEKSPKDTCIQAIYPIRNATIGPYPSKRSGLHYIWSSSDKPNKTTAYSFDPVKKILAVSGRDISAIDNPNTSHAGARWDNGTCTEGIDCIVAGHQNTAHWGGEPYNCGAGRGRIHFPAYVDGGACVRGFGWNAATGRDIDAVGGPVYPPISTFEEYFIGSRAPIAVTTQGYGGQGLIPSWRIESCRASAGAATCKLAPGGSLDNSGWTPGTPIYVDGFPEAAFNGRFQLLMRGANGFSYACPACSGFTAKDVASVTKDVAVNVSEPGRDGQGGIRICRPGLGHCRTMLQPLNVSYGAGIAGNGSGNWQGQRIGALGYQALNFPTVGQWGERVCYVTDFGYLEKLFVACAETGRRDLGLQPFDLDENTPDSCFDRNGRCLEASAIGPASVTAQYRPTNPNFTCSVAISTRPDFGTTTGTAGSETGTATRSRTITGLTANTQYWLNAKCGPAPGKVWDYAVLPLRTK